MSQDLTGLIAQSQQTNQILTAILAALKSGVAIQNTAPSYTVASLPATGSSGQFCWASNGRKPGEGAGSGTGVMVFWNSATSQWYSFASTALVTS